MKIVFMGTPVFAAVVLQKLYEGGHDLAAVFTQAPQKKGRGQRISPSPVHQWALDHQCPVYTPRRLAKDSEALAALEAIVPDVIVVAAYGQLLLPSVLEIPRWGCLNVHASLLPRWRGAAPIQRAIEAGDSQTGICVMAMEPSLDTGAVYGRHAIPIALYDTAESLHDKLAACGGTLLLEVLENLPTLRPKPQDSEGVIYARRLTKAEGFLDVRQSADILARRVRAFYPFPGTAFRCQKSFGGERIKILEARSWKDLPEDLLKNVPPGEIGRIFAADERLFIACNEKSFLEILRLQKQGKKPATTAAFLHGHPFSGSDSLIREPPAS